MQKIKYDLKGNISEDRDAMSPEHTLSKATHEQQLSFSESDWCSAGCVLKMLVFH